MSDFDTDQGTTEPMECHGKQNPGCHNSVDGWCHHFVLLPENGCDCGVVPPDDDREAIAPGDYRYYANPASPLPVSERRIEAQQNDEKDHNAALAGVDAGPCSVPAPREVRRGEHGINCVKAPHTDGGYLHADTDDGPYEVDNVKYCGRCHAWMGTQIVVIER